MLIRLTSGLSIRYNNIVKCKKGEFDFLVRRPIFNSVTNE